LNHADLRAKTILVEHNYTDGDYFEDFAAYYVKCFAHYRKRCRRLHFFSCTFSNDQFRQLFRGDVSSELGKELGQHYLGFVVARPLPYAVVGRTVLRTYNDDGGRRYFTAVRKYKANLFGIQLEVKRSLAFQEQDQVLAACATVSLWCAFQQLSWRFGTPSPRPAVITQAATATKHPKRPIPSPGLILEQMIDAIIEAGLQPEILDVQEHPRVDVVDFIYAYLRMGLPAILGIRVGEERHAITVVGYSIKGKRIREPECGTPPTAGLRVDELYVHDDQVGPFAHMYVKTVDRKRGCLLPLSPGSGKNAPHSLVYFKGSWIERLEPLIVVVPVYEKIRVCYRDIQWIVTILNSSVCAIFGLPTDRVEWDVSLTTVNDYKEDLLQSSSEKPEIRDMLLQSQHPRFIWKILYKYDDQEIFGLLADATDMRQSCPYFLSWHGHEFRAFLKEIIFDVPGRCDEAEGIFPLVIYRLLKESVEDTFAWREGYGPKIESPLAPPI